MTIGIVDLGVDQAKFDDIIRRHRNSEIWEIDRKTNHQWKLKNEI